MTRAMAAVGRHWRAATGAASAATVGLGLLVLACSGVAMAGPRAGVRLQTDAVRQLVAQTPPDAKVIVATEPYPEVAAPQTTLPAGQLDGINAELRQNLTGLPLSAPGTDLMAVTTGFAGITDSARSLGPDTGAQLELVYQTGLASHARVIQGRLPTSAQVTNGTTTFPIAVTVATARRYGLKLGESVPLAVTPPNPQVNLRVAAIVAPVQLSNPFWALDPIQYTPTFISPGNQPPFWEGGAFVSVEELVSLENMLGTNAVVRWVLPLSLGNLTGSQAIALSSALPAALNQDGGNLQATINTSGFSATLTAGVASALTTFAQQASAVSTLLSLLSVSLTAVCAAVLLLVVWLLTEQRHAEFAMLRARGAARRQLAWLSLRGCLPVALAAAVIGATVAIAATPGGDNSLGWWLSGLILLAVLAGVPLITVRRHRTAALAGERQDVPVGKRSRARRLVIEATLVLASVGSLVVLREQGVAPGGSDPYTSLAPVLVAVPVAIVVLRCYPLLASPLLRLTGHRQGVAAFVGLARAIRTAVTAGLPVFAMVLALTLVAFAGMVRDAVLRGEVAASWQHLGADAIVSDPAGFSQAAELSIRAVPGVQRTAALTLTSGTLPDNSPFGVVGVDPAQYGALLASIPGSTVPATVLLGGSGGGAGTPVLATPGLAARLRRAGGTVDIDEQPVRVRLAGQVAAISYLSDVEGTQYLVVPLSVVSSSAGPPAMMLVVGAALDKHALTNAVRHLGLAASVSFRSPVLAALENAPLQHGAYLAFALTSVMAAVLSMLVLLIALVIGGRSRRLTIARMNTMGLSAGQGRRLVVLEVIPQVLAALLGGVACAALLAPLLGPALNLSVFTGTNASVPVRIEPEFVGGAALALAVLALLTLIVQTLVADRTTASALRIGE
jgi:putative ABC transport system permease protein